MSLYEMEKSLRRERDILKNDKAKALIDKEVKILNKEFSKEINSIIEDFKNNVIKNDISIYPKLKNNLNFEINNAIENYYINMIRIENRVKYKYILQNEQYFERRLEATWEKAEEMFNKITNIISKATTDVDRLLGVNGAIEVVINKEVNLKW